jgi:hypothetical protein
LIDSFDKWFYRGRKVYTLNSNVKAVLLAYIDLIFFLFERFVIYCAGARELFVQLLLFDVVGGL